MIFRRRSGVAAMAALVTACSGPQKQPEGGCTKDTDCRNPRICEANVCTDPHSPGTPPRDGGNTAGDQRDEQQADCRTRHHLLFLRVHLGTLFVDLDGSLRATFCSRDQREQPDHYDGSDRQRTGSGQLLAGLDIAQAVEQRQAPAHVLF